MPTVESLLRKLCPEVEEGLKPNLKGLKGKIIRGYLPQVWVLKTQKETVTFKVDEEGNASVKPGAAREPDVIVNIDHKLLVEGLKTREKPEGELAMPEIEYNSKKGKTAFKFLRGRLGI